MPTLLKTQLDVSPGQTKCGKRQEELEDEEGAGQLCLVPPLTHQPGEWEVERARSVTLMDVPPGGRNIKGWGKMFLYWIDMHYPLGPGPLYWQELLSFRPVEGGLVS